MNELALFFGCGGCLLASGLSARRVVCGVEINPYFQEIILRRQEESFLPPFPIWDDIKTFDGRPWRGCVDIVTAGFPCQPFSLAGKRGVSRDDRNLWPETIRVISEVEPSFVLLENVPGVLSYLPVVVRDLRRAGYTVFSPRIVSAVQVGARQERKRVWLVAHAPGERSQKFIDTFKKSGWFLRSDKFSVRGDWGTGDPSAAFMGGGVHGFPFRVDRIKGLGASWIPAVAHKAWCDFIRCWDA